MVKKKATKRPKKVSAALIPTERIEKSILLIRGQKVMLDADLAELYEVETKVLNQAVRRNLRRFPEDFMFQLNTKEHKALRSQTVTLEGKGGRGGHRKYLPYVFELSSYARKRSRLTDRGHAHMTHVRLPGRGAGAIISISQVTRR